MLEEETEEEGETNSAQDLPSQTKDENASEVETPTGSEPDTQLENKKDAERQGREGGQEEAEKASASQWRGPHPSMGLAMLSVPAQIQAQILEKQGKTSKQRDAGTGQSLSETTSQVEDALLTALRQAGLDRPITGFSDPRLKGRPNLGSEWSHQDFPGGRVSRWEGPSRQRQVLRWSEQEALLETTAAGRRQVIQKLGEQFFSQTSPWDPEQPFQ